MQHYFQNRRILIGITGSIAAYKTLELISTLRQLGAEIRVVMTKSATRFVTPISAEALSGHPVYTNLFVNPLLHIELAKWAELILIAPTTANFMAEYAQGLARDLLGAILLASTAPVALAPAMNQAMWSHPATQANYKTLQDRGVNLIGPTQGLQACGDIGLGRMIEVEDLIAHLPHYWQPQSLAGKTVMITAGRTEEALDPVRYLSNYSSGKMGYALAKSAYYQGARVILISGPSQINPPPFCELIRINTAAEMKEAMLAKIKEVDIFIGCAAICDFKPTMRQPYKIKKTKDSNPLLLELTHNPDLLATIAALPNKPFVVGFAAETENLIENAQNKLALKQVDMIIANQVGENLGYNQAENEVFIVTAQGSCHLPKCSKSLIADQIVEVISTYF